MYRFKFFMVFVLVAFAVGFIAFTNASIAGSPFIQNFELKPPNLSGQTCENTGDDCKVLDVCDSKQIVSQVSVFTAKPGKIRIDFCATFYADDCWSCSEEQLECDAFVDNNQAQPQNIELGVAEDEGFDDSGCFTWYAPVSGNYQTHITQVRCENSCDCCDHIHIEEYTHSVFFNKL